MRDAVTWLFSTARLNFTDHFVSFSGPRVQVLVLFNQTIDVDKVKQKKEIIAHTLT